MTDFFTPERFPDCQFSVYTVTPCSFKTKHRGIVNFERSTPYFADNSLGDGAAVKLACQAGDHVYIDEWVTLTWLDWNKFEYKSVF